MFAVQRYFSRDSTSHFPIPTCRLHIPGDIYFSIKILHQHNPKLAVQLFRELDQNVSLTASNLAQKSVGV